jgi:hypothetical protein
MFCQFCGSQLDGGSRFCKSCGNSAPDAALAPRMVVADPLQVLGTHVRVLGIIWLVFSIFHIVMAVWTLVFSYYFLPMIQGVLSNGPASFPFPLVHTLRLIYGISAVYGVAIGALGLCAGTALLQRKRIGRVLAIIAAFLCVLGIPLGTAVGVYTLIVLMPEHAAREYEQIAPTA